MPLTNGSGFGSGSCYFLHWPLRRQQKTNKKVFCLLLFEVTFSSFVTNIKSQKKNSQNSRNHGFSCYFCLMLEGSGAGTLLCLLCGWLLRFPTPAAVWTCRPRPLLSSSSRRDSWWAWLRENRPLLARQTTFPLPPPLRWVPLSSWGLGPRSPTVVLPVLWIRIGFNADPDPDPAFYLNADQNPGSQEKCRSGSGSWSDLKVTKIIILKYRY